MQNHLPTRFKKSSLHFLENTARVYEFGRGGTHNRLLSLEISGNRQRRERGRRKQNNIASETNYKTAGGMQPEQNSQGSTDC